MALRIDGSVLEGGGQILRNAISLATLLSKPITIQNIRAGRSQPGLKSQHVAGIRLAAEICSAKYSGVHVGSKSIEYMPGRIQFSGKFQADAVTAGSTTLLLQVALPILLCSPQPSDATSTGKTHSVSTLTLLGGTNATMAPQIDYTQHVLLPFLHRHFGLENLLTVDVERRGYYPKGGGRTNCTISPIGGPLRAVALLERGPVIAIRGISHVAGLPLIMAKQMAAGAKESLIQNGIDPNLINIKESREKNDNSTGAGSGIVLWAETGDGCVLGGSALGTKGKLPQDVGTEAALELARAIDTGACVDEYLQDQLIIFMALAKGKSSIRTGRPTLHTKTAILIAEQLTDARFAIEEDYNAGQFIIHCDGIGLM